MMCLFIVGFFSENGENAADLDDIRQLTEIAVLCNNTQLPQEKEEKGLFHEIFTG